MSEIFWVTAFLDVPAASHPAALEFWQGVTGYRVSEPRGEHLEFASLVPDGADDHLRVQRLEDGPPRIHLDLHVPDPRVAADRAAALGAREAVPDQGSDRGYVVMRSPGGFVFCFVSHPASRRARPVEWADGGRSLVDQVCLDMPEETYDEEAAFWESVTGWERRPSTGSPEFERLNPPAEQPLQFLLQRLGEPFGEVRAHLDLGCEGREAETRRHVRLGAVVESVGEWWTVLRDPAGAAYCITDHPPR
ncbi:hypothetical protein DDE18_17140 [Nocardioides gansuensis]|uniref:VOC domain-containing protein n=1 Tax=Nocardioides gansuensis TaxID=2138300 RepID=A0A2T8F7R3_9ACTN|nr:VOC family protein [Nocardioides gansuensis]PVG81707.1 hypothetical protein DDE18_17140 [Nocardioides gansuensis]